MPSSKRRSKRRAAKNGAPEVDHTNTSAVFRVKPSGKNSGTIKYKGFVTDKQKLGDEIVELEKVIHPEADIVGKHAIPIDRVDDYDMVGRIYRSNIIGSYLVLHSNLPVLYLTVEYARSIATGSLFQIYLSLKMEDDQRLEIVKEKNFNRFVNLYFSGEWNMTIECDPELKDMWREKLDEKLREEFLLEFHMDYEKNTEKQNMTDEEVLEHINTRVTEELKWYENIMEETPFEYSTLRNARKYLIDLAQDPRFHRLCDVGMFCRVINRRNEQNIEDDTYEIPDPDKVVRMGEVRQWMIENDELIMSDSSSSESDSEDNSENDSADNSGDNSEFDE